MDSLDLQVLEQARDWRREGHAVWLVTVIETWGSAPRPPGALLAMRDDGRVAGSVSGGCVEDDLIDRVRGGERVERPALIAYGVTKEEAARFGLPCGGNLRLVQEPLADTAWIDEVLERTSRHELVARVLDLDDGSVRIEAATRGDAFVFDGRQLRALFGPRWRMLVWRRSGPRNSSSRSWSRSASRTRRFSSSSARSPTTCSATPPTRSARCSHCSGRS